jgi:hypothetical protein
MHIKMFEPFEDIPLSRLILVLDIFRALEVTPVNQAIQASKGSG